MQTARFLHAMQVVLRETIEFDVRQQKKGIPHAQVQVVQTMLVQQTHNIRDVVSFLTHPPTCRNQRLCFRHRAGGCRNRLAEFAKLAVGAQALRATADAKQRPHFIKVCTHSRYEFCHGAEGRGRPMRALAEKTNWTAICGAR